MTSVIEQKKADAAKAEAAKLEAEAEAKKKAEKEKGGPEQIDTKQPKVTEQAALPGDIKVDEKNIKHISFDSMISDSKKKCAKSHPPAAKCANCTFVPPASYKVNYKCVNNHKPYP